MAETSFHLSHVKGPSDSGPGERQQMLHQAHGILQTAGVERNGIVRIDLPDKTSDDSGEAGGLRPELSPIVPALQSGSLFGGRTGVLVVDAQRLLTAEAEVIAGLLKEASADAATVLVTAGALPGPLAKLVRADGEVISIKKLRERDAADWLGKELKTRGLDMSAGAVSALLQRFGSDVAGLSQALDQLASSPGLIDRQTVLARFRNRPDEPMWHYADAVAAGNVSDALRRLSDFWTHGHPLQLLGFLENDLRQRALAAASPDIEVFAARIGRKSKEYPVRKAWSRRKATSDSELQAATDALRRADEILKTAPPETHRVTMERLTVALCRWYGGKARRVG